MFNYEVDFTLIWVPMDVKSVITTLDLVLSCLRKFSLH